MLKNYKEFKKLIINFNKENGRVSDDTLHLIAKKTGNISTLEKPILMQLWAAKERILIEQKHLARAEVMKKAGYVAKKVKICLGGRTVYLAKFENNLYKINKIIYEYLQGNEN